MINAPREHIWKIMSDVENWNGWTSSVRKVKRLEKGPLAVGSRMLIYQPKLPPAYWRVTDLQQGWSFTGVTRGPGVSITAHHYIEEAAGGSKVTLSIEFRGFLAPVLARLTARLNNRYLDLEASGLKKRSEQTSSTLPGDKLSQGHQ
jgi:hypothetical protein